MGNCIICGNPVEHPSHDFCKKCFNSKIGELQERYVKKEGPSSDPAKDIGEAPVSEPATENTRH